MDVGGLWVKMFRCKGRWGNRAELIQEDVVGVEGQVGLEMIGSDAIERGGPRRTLSFNGALDNIACSVLDDGKIYRVVYTRV